MKEDPRFVQDEVEVKTEELCYSSLTEDQTKEALQFSKEEMTKTKDGKCYSPFAKAFAQKVCVFAQEAKAIKIVGKQFSSFAMLFLQKGVIVHQGIGTNEAPEGSTLSQFRNWRTGWVALKVQPDIKLVNKAAHHINAFARG